VKHEERPTERSRAGRASLVLGALSLVVFGSIYLFLTNLLAEEAKPVEQTLQVQVFRPPPPPPPEIEEPPPPEMEQEEIDVPEPEALPDVPDLPEPPPTEMLGLDAEGVAGSDAFGLLANRGGQGLVGGEGRFRWYAHRLTDHVNDHLSRLSELRSREYTARVLLWVDENGRVERVRLADSTGDRELDRALRDALGDLKQFGRKPPQGLPQPIAVGVRGNV